MRRNPAAGHPVFPTRVGVNRRTRRGQAARSVFPTRVGVNLEGQPQAEQFWGLPHTRGGEPDSQVIYHLALESSPHAWG